MVYRYKERLAKDTFQDISTCARVKPVLDNVARLLSKTSTTLDDWIDVMQNMYYIFEVFFLGESFNISLRI